MTALMFILFADKSAAAKETNAAAMILWPEAVTFSKQQMTRLDRTDPSYEHKLKGIQGNPFGPFQSWEKSIKNRLGV